MCVLGKLYVRRVVEHQGGALLARVERFRAAAVLDASDRFADRRKVVSTKPACPPRPQMQAC